MNKHQSNGIEKTKKVAIIIAHPDDETLWCGGTILNHPDWECFVVSLCRKYDPDRAPKFYRALTALGCNGIMGNLDDSPIAIPVAKTTLEKMILELLPVGYYDLIITHNPKGEYTRHLRHEEIGSTVLSLWFTSRLFCRELQIFAFEDGNKTYFPKAQKEADIYFNLSMPLWRLKYDILTTIYGFDSGSWEVKTTPKTEAFWRLTKKEQITHWVKKSH